MPTANATPSRCRACARNLGGECLAMATFQWPCWAYTTNASRVAGDLYACVNYAARRGDALAVNEHRALLRKLVRRQKPGLTMH